MKWFWGVLLVSVVAAVWWGVSHVKVTDNLIWVSCPIAYRWEVDKAGLREILPPGKEKQVVYLACELVKTKVGVGSGTLPPFLYASRDKWLGMSRLQIYLDVPVAELYPAEKREKLTAMMVAKQVATTNGWTQEEIERVGGMAYFGERAVIRIASNNWGGE